MPEAAYNASPEALIVGLARTGDRDAFAELVRRRQSWVRNLLRRCCGDAVLADDLAQQVFLQAWKDIARLREPQKFPGWLKQLAINVWRQHLRKLDPLKHARDEATSDPEQIKPTPGMALDLDKALATLSEDTRLCIVLNYHEGMSHSEIAAATQLPLGTVKSNIRRGTETLKALLSAYVQNDSSVEDVT